MHDPSEAAAELERCVRDLGFQRAMINGQTNGEYLDHDKYSPLWERAAALQALIYHHPAIPSITRRCMPDVRSLGSLCSWAFETAAYALRLVFCRRIRTLSAGPTHSRSTTFSDLSAS